MINLAATLGTYNPYTRSVPILASTTNKVDGEAITKWDLSRFQKNPAILWHHDDTILPIGLGSEVVFTPGVGLAMVVTFGSNHANPFAEQVARCVQEGLVRAVSVGYTVENGLAVLDEVSFLPLGADEDAGTPHMDPDHPANEEVLSAQVSHAARTLRLHRLRAKRAVQMNLRTDARAAFNESLNYDAKAYTVQEHKSDGSVKLHDFGSKKEASAHGMAMRTTNPEVYIHEKGSPFIAKNATQATPAETHATLAAAHQATADAHTKAGNTDKAAAENATANKHAILARVYADNAKSAPEPATASPTRVGESTKNPEAAHEHMVAGNKAMNDALNTYHKEYATIAGHQAKAAEHFEKAAAAGHEYGADSAIKAHAKAAENFKAAANDARLGGTKGETSSKVAEHTASAATHAEAAKGGGGHGNQSRDDHGRFDDDRLDLSWQTFFPGKSSAELSDRAEKLSAAAEKVSLRVEGTNAIATASHESFTRGETMMKAELMSGDVVEHSNHAADVITRYKDAIGASEEAAKAHKDASDAHQKAGDKELITTAAREHWDKAQYHARIAEQYAAAPMRIRDSIAQVKEDDKHHEEMRSAGNVHETKEAPRTVGNVHEFTEPRSAANLKVGSGATPGADRIHAEARSEAKANGGGSGGGDAGAREGGGGGGGGSGQHRDEHGRWDGMEEFLHFDTSRLGKVDRTQVGGARVPARLSRTGVLTYINPDGSKRRELRLASEIFKADSLATLEHAPVIDIKDHTGMVTPQTWRQVSLGHVVGVRQEGKFIVGDLLVQDQATLDAIENQDRTEISCGYRCVLDMTPGVYEGEAYDCVQRNIRYNHAALCPPNRGRAGPEVGLRLDSNAPTWCETHLDEGKEETPMTVKIKLDGRDYDYGSEAHVAKIEENASATIHNLKLDAKTLAEQLAAAVKRADTAEGERDNAKAALDKINTDAAEAAKEDETKVETEKTRKRFRRKLERAVLRFFGDDSEGDDDKATSGDDATKCAKCGAAMAAGDTKCAKCGAAAAVEKKREFAPGAKAPPFKAKDGGGKDDEEDDDSSKKPWEKTDALEERIDSMSDRDLMLFALTKTNENFDATGKSDDYVAARFDGMIESLKTDRGIAGVVKAARAGVHHLDSIDAEDEVSKARRARDKQAATAWLPSTK